jgi:hypothetical protein
VELCGELCESEFYSTFRDSNPIFFHVQLKDKSSFNYSICLYVVGLIICLFF